MLVQGSERSVEINESKQRTKEIHLFSIINQGLTDVSYNLKDFLLFFLVLDPAFRQLGKLIRVPLPQRVSQSVLAHRLLTVLCPQNCFNYFLRGTVNTKGQIFGANLFGGLKQFCKFHQISVLLAVLLGTVVDGFEFENHFRSFRFLRFRSRRSGLAFSEPFSPKFVEDSIGPIVVRFLGELLISGSGVIFELSLKFEILFVGQVVEFLLEV